jgi:D-sedoheptulose 7-phosphate isomerase
MYQDKIEQAINEHIRVATLSKENLFEVLPVMSTMITTAFKSEHKLMLCGNGGSAADAQHLAAEFVSSFSRQTNRRGLPAIALTVDTSVLTAYSNDFDFNGVFSRQVEALGNKGDVLLVFSTSGKSENCILAVHEAKKMGIFTLGFTGTEGELKDLVDICLKVNSKNTQHIQEIHQVAYHALAGLVENQMC